MTDEAELLQRLGNREKNSIDEAIRIYTPYLSTCLLYTSPSPRDRSVSRMPSSA